MDIGAERVRWVLVKKGLTVSHLLLTKLMLLIFKMSFLHRIFRR